MRSKKLFVVCCLFLLSLSFLLVSQPQIIPKVYGFTGASGAFGNWTWSSPTLTIIANATASAGDTEAHAYGFQDIVNAIDYYSWSAFYNCSNSGKQFEFSFKIVIGDGATTTWFVDIEKQVCFKTGVLTVVWQYLIEIKDKANFRSGVLDDATTMRTSRGNQFTSLESTYNHYLIGQSSSTTSTTLYLYSSDFKCPSGTQAAIDFKGNGYLYNSHADYKTQIIVSATPASGTIKLFNIIKDSMLSTTAAHFSFSTSPTLVDRISVTGFGRVFYQQGTSSKTITNIYARGYTTLVTISGATCGNTYLVDPDVDLWNFIWSTGTTKVYRQYTFDLTITTAANVPIEDANVTLEYFGEGGGTHGTWLTDANGEIPLKTVTEGFFNQTGGDTIYDYNPYEITITKTGYITYQRNFTQLEKKSWNIALLPEIKENPVARFNNTITTVNPNQNVTFDGSMSYDPDGGNITNYSWDFGDGNITSSSIEKKVWFDTGGTASDSFGGVWWDAQTFTTHTTFNITSVILKMCRSGSPGTLTVSIRTTAGNGKPNGTDLTVGTTDANAFTTSVAGAWYEVDLTPYPLLADTKYAIVCRATSNSVYWRSNPSSNYTDGQLGWSSNSGITWTMYDTEDGMFEVYGNSPLMPIITHEWASVGNYTITLTVTDDENVTDTFGWQIEVTTPTHTSAWGLSAAFAIGLPILVGLIIAIVILVKKH